jgi:hypothetical protein
MKSRSLAPDKDDKSGRPSRQPAATIAGQNKESELRRLQKSVGNQCLQHLLRMGGVHDPLEREAVRMGEQAIENKPVRPAASQMPPAPLIQRRPQRTISIGTVCGSWRR